MKTLAARRSLGLIAEPVNASINDVTKLHTSAKNGNGKHAPADSDWPQGGHWGMFLPIPVESIKPFKDNPRQTFDDTKLEELAASIMKPRETSGSGYNYQPSLNEQKRRKAELKKEAAENAFRRQLLSAIADKADDSLNAPQQHQLAAGLFESITRNSELRTLFSWIKTFSPKVHEQIKFKGDRVFESNFTEVLRTIPNSDMPMWILVLSLAKCLERQPYGYRQDRDAMLLMARACGVDPEKVKKAVKE